MRYSWWHNFHNIDESEKISCNEIRPPVTQPDFLQLNLAWLNLHAQATAYAEQSLHLNFAASLYTRN